MGDVHGGTGVGVNVDGSESGSGSGSKNGHVEVESEMLDVAIIGAGLAGTLLALSLKQSQPTRKITIFESRAPTAPELASGIILTPNGLHILQKLHIYPRIKDICWTSSHRTYVNDKDETTRRVLTASEELHGFQNHRLYRRVLLRTVKDMCNEQSIPIVYNARFEGIMSDMAEHVTFRINDTDHHTSLLIGADGIYSSVRRHIAPSITPEYTGTIGVLAHISWPSISWPRPDFPKQCTIQGQPGAFFMIPETSSTSSDAANDVMVGLQLRHPPQSRAAWDSLANDKDALSQFFARNYDAWHATGRKIIDAVVDPHRAKDSLFLWPFLRMPRLGRWFSDTGRVVLVGDAAHAVPPSSGQGVNQALEDVWSLTLVLDYCQRQQRQRKNGNEKGEKEAALAFWQANRQTRVDQVFDWAVNATNVSRMSVEERSRLIREGKVPDPEVAGSGGVEFFDDMMWLYVWKGEEEVRAWIEGRDRGRE